MRCDALQGKRILLGVTGSIASYKSPELIRRLQDQGAIVTVVMTEAAKQFVTPLTLRTVSRQPVYSSLFEERDEILHLTLVHDADLVLIAPATANFIGKAASGLADDLLSTLFLAVRGPILIAPAMDSVMWEHAVTRMQLQRLRDAGVEVVGPDEGPLASGLVGMGRLADLAAVIAAVNDCLADSASMIDEVVLVTAGPTREALDPVRYLSNRSSGKMGYAIARAAQRRGARVMLVSGPTALAPPFGVDYQTVETTEEMAHAVEKRFPESSLLIMAAAVADYRPQHVARKKLPRQTGTLQMTLESTPDILRQLHPDRPRQLVVGFAAETDDLLDRAMRKREAKQLDLIAANRVGPSLGFDVDENELTLIDRNGRVTTLGDC